MTGRRLVLPAVMIAASVHLWGVSRTILPAQDGLKFIRVAQGFQTKPWGEVVRGSDQHPLYPALVALLQPAFRPLLGDSPDSWRIAAQAVSILAYFALLVPLHRISSRMFGPDAAGLCVLLFVLLPIPAELGRDTLSDTLALACLLWGVELAAKGLQSNDVSAWIGCGCAVGLGYLTRPEVVLAAVSAGLCFLVKAWAERREGVQVRRSVVRFGLLFLTAFVPIGAYALTKGEVSEKLALRAGVALPPSAAPKAGGAEATSLPRGLDDPQLDFSAKEETGKNRLKGKPGRVLGRLSHEWLEGIGWILGPFAAWGLLRSRRFEGSPEARRLVLIHLAVFSLVVIRHATSFGYLSGRHAMTLVVLTLPFAAASIIRWARGVPARRGLSPRTGRILAGVGLCGLIVLGVSAQAKAMHSSRWGHRQAGDWLMRHADERDAVLDTRGWASFVRPGPKYDYWHVKQALNDSRLHYFVVGSDELDAGSKRAKTLNFILGKAGKLVASFPEKEEGGEVTILVYRFDAPPSWEGIKP